METKFTTVGCQPCTKLDGTANQQKRKYRNNSNLTFRWTCIVINSYNKTNKMHWFLKFIFGIKLYIFRTVPLSIIRSFSLYISLFIQHNGDFSPENYVAKIRNWHFSACCFLLLPVAAWQLNPNIPLSIQFTSTLYSSLKVTGQVKRHFCEIWLLHCAHPSFHTYEWHYLPLFCLQLNYDSDEICMRSTRLWSS
jgi:hypothetical protein